MIWIIIKKFFTTLRELPMELIGKLILIGAVIFVFTIAIIYAKALITTPDNVDYCYVGSNRGQFFSVEGVKSWRSNVSLGSADTYERASDLMAKNPVCNK